MAHLPHVEPAHGLSLVDGEDAEATVDVESPAGTHAPSRAAYAEWRRDRPSPLDYLPPHDAA